MLTLKQLKEMKLGCIFATGEIVDSPDGISFENTGFLLRWVAVRGDIHDWAIYCHWLGVDDEYIHRNGQKVCEEKKIKKLVPCDDEAFKMYRY